MGTIASTGARLTTIAAIARVIASVHRLGRWARAARAARNQARAATKKTARLVSSDNICTHHSEYVGIGASPATARTNTAALRMRDPVRRGCRAIERSYWRLRQSPCRRFDQGLSAAFRMYLTRFLLPPSMLPFPQLKSALLRADNSH